MWRRIISSWLLFTLLLVAPRTFAQSGHGLVSPAEIGRVGLKRAWYTHIEVDRAKGRLAFLSQYINASRAIMIYEIVHDGGKMEISEKHLDPFSKPLDQSGRPLAEEIPLPPLVERLSARLGRVGSPLGKEGAKKLADETVEELTNQGLNPKVNEIVVPEITLYVASDRGVVHALDGETGRTRWALPIGRMNHPTLEPAANDKYVAIVNGSILYVVSSADGKLAWQRQLKGAPGAGGALTGDLVHVPMVNGMLESYSLIDPKKPVVFFKSHGRAMIQPTVTDKSVCWTTDRGHLYVGHGDKPGVRYRLEANDTIAARATYKAPNLLFVASVDGYLYCIQELSGEIKWRFSAGEPLSQQPVVVDDAVFVVSDQGNLFRVAIDTGLEQWTTPRVRSLLAASKDRLYCAGESGKVLVIDMRTGARQGSFEGVDLDMKFMNGQSDRIFVGTKTGLIQCLHEPGLRYPIVRSVVTGVVEKKPPSAQPGEKPGEADPSKPPVPAGEPDPFGEKKPVDPSAPGGKKEPAPVEDPFGAGPPMPPKGAKPPPAAVEKDPFGA